MKSYRFRILVFALAILFWTPGAKSQTTSSSKSHSAAFNSMSQKLDRIALNGQKAQPDPTPTRISADEANAWMNEGGVKLPTGVDQVQFRSDPGAITTDARVDFDKITASHSSYNPLLSLFSGVHQVEVVAQASGANGEASVHVQSVSLDGVQVPRMALELFVNKYLKPKYPNVGLDSRFHLPSRVDSAAVGRNEVSVVQR